MLPETCEWHRLRAGYLDCIISIISLILDIGFSSSCCTGILATSFCSLGALKPILNRLKALTGDGTTEAIRVLITHVGGARKNCISAVLALKLLCFLTNVELWWNYRDVLRLLKTDCLLATDFGGVV